jgi:GNAT superfamily N-acetyltransferase
VRIVDGFSDPRYARYLEEHYADAPIRYLPAFVVKRLLRRWRCRSEIFFLIAQLNETTAGFLFGQAVGARPWRRLLADPLTLPFAAAALVRERLRRRPGQRSSDGSGRELAFPSYDDAPERVPHDWSAGEAANVEFIFVDPAFRGRDIAGQLLAGFADRLRAAEIGTSVAYIATSNAASERAFRKAGWSIYFDGHTLRAVRSMRTA